MQQAPATLYNHDTTFETLTNSLRASPPIAQTITLHGVPLTHDRPMRKVYKAIGNSTEVIIRRTDLQGTTTYGVLGDVRNILKYPFGQ